MRSESYKTVKTTGRRYKGNPIVLWPIAQADDIDAIPTLANVTERYVYPAAPTDTAFIFWDGPTDMGCYWKGFFGGLMNLSPEGQIEPHTGHAPAEFYRIDVCGRGYSQKSSRPLGMRFTIRGVAYPPTYWDLPALNIGWTVGTIFGNWTYEDFNKPVASADFTNGPYISFWLQGSSASKDAWLHNAQIHLYRK